MNSPVRGYVGAPIQSASERPTTADNRRPADSLSPTERNANALAIDWQIVLHLRALFERDPGLISSLLQNCDGKHPTAYTITLLAAAREALAERPDSVELHYHAARAAACVGEPRNAKTLLERALRIDSGHEGALLLLAEVGKQLEQPHFAGANLPRALAAGAVSTEKSRLKGHDRRGNELPA
jgi:hypothetical protein